MQDFYSAFSNKELYVRYVNKLVALHIKSNNLTEAGFALYEHAKILKWDHASLPAALKSPRYALLHYHSELKEQLYEDIISYMEDGQVRRNTRQLGRNAGQLARKERVEQERAWRIEV